MRKKAVVIHSGGMDSSICLALACREFGKEHVLSLSFAYRQRHIPELEQAKQICKNWGVDHVCLTIDCLQEITTSALLNQSVSIHSYDQGPPNTLVVGRNGLMAHLGGIYAEKVGAKCIYLGIMEIEGENSGYRDCSRAYMDLQQQILRIDLNDSLFEIRTPLVRLTKKETLELAADLEILEYLLMTTITCYEGISQIGCQACPACQLRNRGLNEFLIEHPSFVVPYANFVPVPLPKIELCKKSKGLA